MSEDPAMNNHDDYTDVYVILIATWGLDRQLERNTHKGC
jgi:hypothetical protein